MDYGGPESREGKRNNKNVHKKGNVQEDSSREIVLSTIGNKEHRFKQIKNKLR